MAIVIFGILILLAQAFTIFVLIKMNSNIQSVVHDMAKKITEQNDDVVNSLKDDKKTRSMILETLKAFVNQNT